MTSTATRAGPPGGAAPPAGTAAEPNGRREPGDRSGLAGMLDLTGQAYRSVVRSTSTTPGRHSVIAVGLVVLALLTALVGAIAVQDKKDTIDGLIDHREPLAAAAQEVYRSLSDADATTASGFLSTGAEPPELRARYEQDIARAGAALAKAASDSAGVPAAAAQVDIISQRLPVYTGLVETARANNRQGFPVGASYLREASELMRATILPAAESLYQIDTERLFTEQDDATDFPWITALLSFGLLGALIYTQVYLRRKTNRVFNVGLVVATVAVGIAILWSTVAMTVQSVLVSSGGEDGTEQVDVLVRARIAALQARADETLTLVARGGGSDYEKEFGQLAAQLTGPDGRGGLLQEARDSAEGQAATQHLDKAAENAAAWLAAHAEVRELDDTGDHASAVTMAIDGQDPGSAAATFSRLDANLSETIGAARQTFLDDTTNGSRALSLLAPGFAVLAVIAALGTTIGIRERLLEYR
jgi:hypothetical protein